MSKARDIADSAGVVGGSSTDSSPRRVQVDGTANAFYEERLVRMNNTHAAWTTIATITPSSNGGNVYGDGIVEAYICGVTNGVGSGNRFSRWKFSINAGVITYTSLVESPSGTGAPQFRLTGNGSIVQCQIQSSNGTNGMNGTTHLGIYVPAPAGGVTFTIT